MKGQHKVSVTVEMDGEDTLTFHQEFSSGNPAFHASEFVNAARKPVTKIKKAMESVFGIKPEERDGIGRKTYRQLDEQIESAQREGAKVFRVVFYLTDSRVTLRSESLHQHQLEGRWEEFRTYPDLIIDHVEYGILVGKPFDYEWHTL